MLARGLRFCGRGQVEGPSLIMWGSSSEVSNDQIKKISELLPEDKNKLAKLAQLYQYALAL